MSDSEDEDLVDLKEIKESKAKRGARSKNVSDDEEILNPAKASDDEDDEDEDLEGEDVYLVEKIITHQISEEGVPMFQVKWEGYEAAKDRTWEPEENLRTAKDIFDKYIESIGGRHMLTAGVRAERLNKKRARASNVAPATPASSKRSKIARTRKSESASPGAEEKPVKQFQPPAGSWEDEVKAIDAAEGEHGEVQVYLTWKNGQKTQHPLHVTYQRCPQKMLKFYESHLVFKKNSNA